MNIDNMKTVLSQIEEISVMGKTTEVDGVICHVMGVVRCNRQIRLLVLQYDEAFRQRMEENEAAEAEACYFPDKPVSNRIIMRGEGRIDAVNPFQAVSGLWIGELEFAVPCSETRRLRVDDVEFILLLSKFLLHGWQPGEIELPSIDMLFLTSLQIEGEYEVLPAFGENPALRFIMRPNNVSHLVEQPITLIVGGEYPDKLYFRDSTTGEEGWAQINRVYLSDIWTEMATVFDNPELQKQMTPEEIERAKVDFAERFAEICPKGMHYPIVEYEAEEDVFLTFYSRRYLDNTPVSSSGAMGFIVSPDQPEGVIGLRLKAAIIQEPVPAHTVRIDAELFQYSRVSTASEIVLK